MKIAYLVMAHNNPGHLQRLVKALSSSSSAFFIHIDRKSRLEDFSSVKGENVTFSQKRLPVYYFDYSHVEVILMLLGKALADQRCFDYFLLLSGTDYPLQPAAYIDRFFERNRGTEFMNIVPMPCEKAGKPVTRLTTYRQRPGDIKIFREMRKLAVRFGTIPEGRDYKTYLRNMAPYGGSTWWALTRGACEYLQNFTHREPKVVSFFKHTECPDESFFQTILGNSHYKARMRRNLTYTDWSGGGAHPAYLTEKHLEFFKASSQITMSDHYGTGELLFARKFSDQAQDIAIKLDRFIKEKEDRLAKGSP